jgi:putative hydrolase of HD superfamily
VLLDHANEGQSWRENGIGYERVVHRIKPPIQAGALRCGTICKRG